MNKWTCIVFAIALLLTVAACGRPAVGYYLGANPDVSFDITRSELSSGAVQYYVSKFQASFPEIVVGDARRSGDCWWAFTYPIPIRPDGTFSDSDAPESTTFSGKIDGETVTGHLSCGGISGFYLDNGCWQELIEVESPVVHSLDWTASLAESRPPGTPTTAPRAPFATAVPPRLGRYEGTDVSFTVTTAGVEDFEFTDAAFYDAGYGCHSCPFDGHGVLLAIDSHGCFSPTDRTNGSLKGLVSGDAARGMYWYDHGCAICCTSGSVCSYDPATERKGTWNARWVGP
jgi:hypothetical protein